MNVKCMFLIIFIFTLSSCSLVELTPEQQREIINHHLTTRSVKPIADSVEMLSRMQSDKKLILMNQIWFREGQFILDLSREDAESLGISDELYDTCCRYIENINDSLR